MTSSPLLARLLRIEWLPLLAMAVAAIIVLALISSSFFSTYNLFVMLRILSVTSLVALSQMVTIAIGQMNLAVGAIGGLVAILFGAMLELYGVPIPLAVLAAVGVGLACGAINGWLIAWTRINGFIITLAMLSVFTGLNYGITKSIPFYNMPQALKSAYDSYLGPVPMILFIPVLAALGVGFILNFTRAGRHMLAMGGNPAAAELAGISISRTTIFTHVLSGGLAGLAGVVAVARLGTAEPTIGADWLLASFAAPVIGGAALAGGYVSVIGTMIAVVLVILLENGLLLARTNPFYVQFFLGALILLAVMFNQWRARRVAMRVTTRRVVSP
jgi:ribose transport system permease protein